MVVLSCAGASQIRDGASGYRLASKLRGTTRERPFSKAVISFLRQLIKEAHKDFPEHLGPLLRVRAHDVRSIVISLLWSINRAVSDILEVACWRTHSVFADHYLKTIQRVHDDVFAIGPIMAAGSVIP